MNTNGDDESGKKKCVPVLEDYYECMHHKKEVSLLSTSTEAAANGAHTLHIAGRSNNGPTGSIPEIPIETRTGGCTYSRADTESRSTRQGGGHKQGVGLEFIED